MWYLLKPKWKWPKNQEGKLINPAHVLKSLSQQHANFPQGIFSKIQFKMFQNAHGLQEDGQSLWIPSDERQTSSHWQLREEKTVHMSITLRFTLQTLGHPLHRAFPPGKPPWQFQQPKQSQRGMHTCPHSTYHFTQHKLLINCRAFQGHRGIILQDELSTTGNKLKE